MWSDRERRLIQRYSGEIRQSYLEGSRVPVLATVRREPDARAPNFLKIGRRFRIPREFFEEDHFIVVRPFADFIDFQSINT